MSVIEEIAAERKRQIEKAGYTTGHDDLHTRGSLAQAAACYCDPVRFVDDPGSVPLRWPWDHRDWKPKDQRSNLIRAAALIVAEIERLDRRFPSEEQK